MTNPLSDVFIWQGQVREYEIDMQGVVNNAYYPHYFHQARAKHLLRYGIDWKAWHDEGFDFMLYHMDITFLSSLKADDHFQVSSQFKKTSRLKIGFEQTIQRLNTDNTTTTMTKAVNTIICVCRKTGRPVFPEKLDDILFSKKSQ